jgi:DNA-binding transcriptional LysR family regulator
MDRLKQIESFVAVAGKGSLTAAASAEGVAPAVIGRRIDALEERLGVKLLLRTTRRITLTHEGSAFLEDCQRLLSDLASAEASVSAGGVKASGHLRITAPAGFGRRHVAPLVPRFLAQHPDVSLSLNLSDRLVDIVNEGVDCAVRVGDLPDSALVSVRLAENRRLCVASPAYLKRAGTPRHPNDLSRHECLTLSSETSQSRGWAFVVDAAVVHLRPSGRLDCSDGQVLHDWCMAGMGIAWRSTWEVEHEVAAGQLVSLLDEFAATPNGIYAVFPARQAPAVAGAPVDRFPQAQLRRPSVLGRPYLLRHSFMKAFALVALLALGVDVAGLHLFLLCLLGVGFLLQAFLHEGLALAAGFAGGFEVGAAGAHLGLLLGRRARAACGHRGRTRVRSRLGGHRKSGRGTSEQGHQAFHGDLL